MGLYRPKGDDSKVQMPITPMLDMTFQLLFFFLLNYHPSRTEGELDIVLPSEKPTLANDNTSKAPEKALSEEADEEPKEPPEVTVTVKADQGTDPKKAGQITEISVTLKSGTTPLPWEGADIDKLLGPLRDHLKKVRDNDDPKEEIHNKTDVIMKGDRKLKWQYVVRVRDAIQKAGFNNVHFASPSDR